MQRGTVAQRNLLLATLEELGPHVGLSAVRARHPEISRAEARHLQQRYRRYWRRKHERWIDRLRWAIPGSVWAMDFTKPKYPIDGVYRRVLVVLDLASGYILLAQPCEGETAEVALEALSQLLKLHGAPLVVKSDNGSAFIDERVRHLLAENSVQHLFSPPYWPRYNGACERAIGWLKTRVRHLAELDLRPESWSSSDLQRARAIANEITRPWGHRGPSRAEVWNTRKPITDEQRKSLAELRAAKLGPNRTRADEVRASNTLEAALRARSASDRSEATARLRKGTAGGRSTPAPGSGQNAPTTLSKHEQASLERTALAAALADLGFLCYRRRRFTPPITR